jgi:hypothetical protein
MLKKLFFFMTEALFNLIFFLDILLLPSLMFASKLQPFWKHWPRKVLSVTTKESLLKQKDPYSWHPCTNWLRSAALKTEEKNFFFLQNKLSWCWGQLYCAFPFTKGSLVDLFGASVANKKVLLNWHQKFDEGGQVVSSYQTRKAVSK